MHAETAPIEPLRLTRVFPAPRGAVFKAWTTSEHVQRWFCPETFSIPEAAVEARVGGPFDVLMRAPSGEQHWLRGTFVEIVPDTRLVIDMRCDDSSGAALFRAYTEVNLSDAPGGTRLDVVQTYTLLDPDKGWMIQGAPDGWRTTLDKLEREVTERSVVHGTFHLERRYNAGVARVWAALTDAEAKQQWFSGPPGQWTLLERHMDVRPGGGKRAPQGAVGERDGHDVRRGLPRRHSAPAAGL